MRLAFLSLFVFLVASPASAFTPDDVELAHLLRGKYGALSSWEAEMAFADHPGVTVHLWYARGRWRQEWAAGDKALAVGVNGNVSAKCTESGFPLSPLFVWMVPDPVETWKSWGVDNATASYGFCDDLPCYLFGADPGDDTSPAVFMNNESMAPLLVRYGSGTGLTTVEYGDYRTLGGFDVPRSVKVTRDGSSLSATVKWIAVNRADSEELYARDGLDSAPCADPPEPFAILRDLFRYPAPR
jgi:hypothetical protein